jgi:hypothetical protein
VSSWPGWARSPGRPPPTRPRDLWSPPPCSFYVGAELQEPHLCATLREHDAVIFQDPDFEVFIDPDGDSHEY